MATEAFSGTEAIGATEWSLPRDASYDIAQPQTADGVYVLVLDVSDMVLTDELQIRVYEKARSGDTQRIVYEATLIDAQADPLWISHVPFPLLHGWDMTLDAIAGTITVLWSIRKAGA
jgi:hypothetical protein